MCKECGCQSGPSCECGHGHGHGHGFECECGMHFVRRYQTKAEQIEELEAYLEVLKTEVQAVEEHLADLRK